ncbi:MAG: hypothetical protein IPK19_15880 [Chloroflexi bacterium]|nr:hypothetical protein [Chloroflexota bacterium]
MNRHLWRQVEELLAGHDRAILTTCGVAEPQVSVAAFRLEGNSVLVFLPGTSDHLFNLEARPNLVLLSTDTALPRWELHGSGQIERENGTAPHPWQVIVRVQPLRLHLLSADGDHPVETIDLV